MSKEEKRVPELRFKGFHDDWEQRKLGELSEIVRGASPRPIKDKRWFDQNSDVGWLRISDVTAQNGKIHYLSQKLSKEGQSKTRVLNTPHLLVSIAASVGKPVINYTKTGVHDGFLIFLTPLFNIMFVFEWLEYFRPKWQRYGQPGSQVNLNSAIVKKQNIHIPTSTEQNKVAELLMSFNKYLDLHQRKFTTLLKIKQTYLMNIFPKDGLFSPELRFKGFHDDWEQRKFGELSEIVRGASPRPIKDKRWFDQNSDVGWLRISDVTAQNGKIHYLSQKLSKEGQSKTRVLNTPHLLVSIAASVGKPVINYTKTGVHDGFLIFLTPLFNIMFVFEWLEYFRPKWQRYGQPGSQVNLNSAIVKKQYINIPSSSEQNKIAEFLISLNKCLDLRQKKINEIVKLKRVYLQKLFL